MRARALGELSGFAPSEAVVDGICTRLLIRMRTLPFTTGAGMGLVTCWAATASTSSSKTAVARSDLTHTLTFLIGAKTLVSAAQIFACAPPIDLIATFSTASELIG